MRHIKTLMVTGCLIAAALLGCGIALADIAIGPLTKTVQIAPGNSETVIYRVANKSDEAVSLNISARTWFSLSENADIKIDRWLKLGTDKMILPPKREKKLRVKINVPRKATGELAGMIYFTPQREKDQTIRASYGVSLYVFVKGTEVINVEIGDILLTSKEAKDYVTVEILNKGNVHVRPHVKVLIENKEGLKKETELPFGKPIFGGQKYTFVGEIKDLTLEKGTYKITALVDYGNKENIITKSKEVKIDGSSE